MVLWHQLRWGFRIITYILIFVCNVYAGTTISNYFNSFKIIEGQKFYFSDDSYGVVVSEQGKSGIINLLVIFDLDYKVKDLVVLDHNETRSNQVMSKRFFKQFFKRSLSDKSKIHTITGATVSSKAFIRAVDKSLEILEKIKICIN